MAWRKSSRDAAYDCRLRTFLLTALLLTGSAFAQNPAITVTVDVAANRHSIDPRIYGAAWADSGEIDELGLTLNRWGGNAMSRYNWAFSTANRCKDYYFFNIPDIFGGGANGESADDFIAFTRNAGADPVMTIPMLSLLPESNQKQCSFPVATYPGQEDHHLDQIDCGNGRMEDGNGIVGDGPRILGNPDPSNISIAYPLSHQGDWVQHMIDEFGSAAAGGMKYYSLDNEPGLWSFDHWDVHPTGTSYDEVWEKMEELGAIIRAKDPAAVITGGEEWGWSGYFMSGLDMENLDGADRAAHDDLPYYDWLLQQFADYEADTGVRILDVWTAHYYPQSGEFWSGSTTTEMQELRNRSTRSLWDPNYVDESWIGGTEVGGAKVKLIPRLKDWVNNNYPGTQIGITEYNWGDVAHINAATTQADILGIFGREDLDMAIRWTSPDAGSFVGNAFRMYRNYDGNDSTFGDVSVSASVPNPDEVSAFAAERTSDGALTIMIIEKTVAPAVPPPVTRSITVTLAGFTPARNIDRWQLGSSNTITQLADIQPGIGSIALTVPLQSITLLVVPAATPPDPPTIGSPTPGDGSASIAFTPPANDGGSNITSYLATCQPNGATGSGASSPVSVAGLTNGVTYSCSVQAINAAGTSAPSGTVNVTPGSSVPILTATATSTSQVSLSWTPVAGAIEYQIQRSVNDSAFMSLGVVAATSTNDGGLTANTTYLYKVRPVDGPFSNVDGATTIVFTDSSVVAGTAVKAVHFTELRTAVNAMRAAAGLSPQVFTDATLTTIKAVHLTELRTALDAARADIGLPALTYTNPSPSGTTVKAVHVNELRSGVN